jgi:hypothetical protein
MNFPRLQDNLLSIARPDGLKKIAQRAIVLLVQQQDIESQSPPLPNRSRELFEVQVVCN